MPDLKSALSDHLSSLPADAVDRVRRVDYRPRTRRLSTGMTVGAVGGTAAATAAVVSAVVLSTATPAFAGWTASPTASTKPTAAVNASCASRLASLPGSPGGTWKPVVTDVRGPFSLTVYRDDGTYGTCLSGRSLTAVDESTVSSGSGSMSASGSGRSSGRATVGSTSTFDVGGAGSIRQLSVTHLSATGQGTYTVADGHVTSDVSALTFVLNDGKHVETTLGAGWFVAWWPGSADAVSAIVTTPAGTKTEPVKTTPHLGLSGPSGRGFPRPPGLGSSSSSSESESGQ